MRGGTEPPFLQVRQLRFAYSAKEALPAISDVQMELQSGEFVALLGPSGCGKSTLLKILAGYLRPSQGEVLQQGEPISGPHRSRAVLFQSNTLYPWLTVEENVAFGLKLAGMEKEKRLKIARQLLREVRLEEKREAKVFELSGGMKQRVALARVLAHSPEMVLMDEPLGALDAMTRLQMQALIRSLWKERRMTVFFITHDIDEALALANRVFVMSSSPGTLLREYRVNYSDLALRDEKQRVPVDEAYLQLKAEILDLIEQQSR